MATISERPISQLCVKETKVERPAFPVIDAHNHLGDDFGGGWHRRSATELLDRLDEANVSAIVDLDGGWSEDVLDARLAKFKEAAPDRFAFFGGPGWHHWDSEGNQFPIRAAERFKKQVERGAEGLKIWKDFGLYVCDDKGARVEVDDPRLDPLWQMAGELKVPVMIHVADPVAFFEPIDERNERAAQLLAHPEWRFPQPEFPHFDTIMAAFSRLLARHPNVNFIGAHVGCYSENLGWVAEQMDLHPNFYVDISARISELGRQPYSAARFLNNYQDRVLFGIDAGPDLNTYRTYYRFLETDDEYFEHSEDTLNGDWRIYGVNLSETALRKIYSENAKRLLKNLS